MQGAMISNPFSWNPYASYGSQGSFTGQGGINTRANAAITFASSSTWNADGSPGLANDLGNEGQPVSRDACRVRWFLTLSRRILTPPMYHKAPLD